MPATGETRIDLIVTANADAETGALTADAAASPIRLTGPGTPTVEVARGVRLRIRVFLEGGLE